jgi:hypothetical protein
MKIGILIILFSLMLGSIALLDSCKNDAVQTTNEYITSLKVIAQNLSTNHTDTFEYVNFNETRPNPPSYVDTIHLQAKSSYAIQVLLYNEALNPVQSMTDTIIARADRHLLVYNVDPSTGFMTVKIQDKDSKGLPLGLLSTWSTADSTNGWLRLMLRHQQGNKNGTETPGSTDFEADFPVVVR